MIVCYGLLGVFADIALIANNFLMIGILSALGATLTLPGIAGIVLTMGMAVDANVLIYERMREEAHAGRSIIAALDTGFRKAFGTIIDSHLDRADRRDRAVLSSALAPIRGFAVTLAIGIVSTLFTAYLVTRLIVSIWVRVARPEESCRSDRSSPSAPLIPDGTNLPFMKWARIPNADLAQPDRPLRSSCSSPSASNDGIDFKGGTSSRCTAASGTADLAGDPRPGRRARSRRRADPERRRRAAMS